jgi:hypothetical protein
VRRAKCGDPELEEPAMSRKNWSNLFLFLAAVSLMLGVLPGNPFRVFAWIALPVCLGLGTVSRRRMA